MLFGMGGILQGCAPQCGACQVDWQEDEEVVDAEVFQLELLARAAVEQGDLDRAACCLIDAGKRAPRAAHLLNARAVVNYARHRHADAARDLEEALALAPHTSLYRYNIGCTLAAQGHTRAAAEELRTAFSLDPTLTKGYPRYSRAKWKILCPLHGN
eukprot:TRINITY_DN958_c1_g1_i5.p1 TRINITY_DN958_c1_g1~~TRINITY_DN958_c1_g1_i5.p1  ORF type:complete len:157 (+),score=50.91 TRINITY_DN958_c1_g1_i5:76-546(+)